MIVVQLILLKVALDNRAPTGARDGLEHTPFQGYTAESGLQDLLEGRRPYGFWQWNSSKPYAIPTPFSHILRSMCSANADIPDEHADTSSSSST